MRFLAGDIVRFKTQWPWATREARIIGPTHPDAPEGNYIAIPLAPFDDVWKPAPAGTQMWLPQGEVVGKHPLGEAPPDMWHPDLERGFSRCDYSEKSHSPTGGGACERRCTKEHGHVGEHTVGGWALAR